MNIDIQRFAITKRYPLTISRGTSTGSENLLVTVAHEGITGMGEMAPTSGGAVAETVDTAEKALQKWIPFLVDVSPWDMQRMENLLNVQDGERAAFCALDCALHDWQGKRLNLPVWKMLGLNISALPPTSLTVGINPPDVIRVRVPQMLMRTGARYLKVKLGSPQGVEADKASFIAAQEAAQEYALLCESNPVGWRVDANGGWTVRDAHCMLDWLAERNVEFVEQPLKRGQEADLALLHKNAPLPIYVDESVRTSHDIPALAKNIDGVNLKLMKCGGLREALRIIHTARAYGLKLMIGCMSETSLAITAAAQLGSLVDALDLDSHLNLNPDPFLGAEYVHGTIRPPDTPGFGIHCLELLS